MSRPTVAVHKFSSCDGCQLAFLNLGEDLLTLADLVDIRYFAEAGPLHPYTNIDIAFVEGSISSAEDLRRIETIRANSHFLITIGACATSGGLQALRNMADARAWAADIYASPEFISTLDTATPIRQHVKVDFELWGCPVSSRQLVNVISSLLSGVAPLDEHEKLCLECKRQHAVCVMVARGEPCMGPVTRTGCGALCPSFGRACYACYGPAENPNTDAMANRLHGLGLVAEEVAKRFLFINSGAEAFNAAGRKWEDEKDH